jgi:hypothetical protein
MPQVTLGESRRFGTKIARILNLNQVAHLPPQLISKSSPT